MLRDIELIKSMTVKNLKHFVNHSEPLDTDNNPI
ncbi:GSCOCT00014033001.2-RA-CDS, partial [Cotesia congregata]